MKSKILFLTLFFLGLLSYGQDKIVVKNMKEAVLYGSTEEKIAAYNQLGWQYRKLYPDSSIYFLNSSLELLELQEDRKHEPETYNFLGVAYLYKGDFLKSYDYHEKAKDMARERQDSLQYAHALNSIGRLYEGTTAYDKAIEYYNEALSVFQSLNDRVGLAYIYSSLATFYQSQKSFIKAEEMSKRALQIRLEEELWAGAAFSYLELAKIYNDGLKERLAFDMLQLAKNYGDSVQANLVLKAEINTEISSLLRKKGEYNNALKLMTSTQDIAEGISNQNLFMKVYNELGKLNYDLKQYDKAIAYHEKVVGAAEKSAFWQELKDAYLNLSHNYEQLGNVLMAYEYFKKYNEIEIKFLDVEKARLVQQHESRIALETRAKENELLKVEKQKNEALLAEQNIRNLALVGLAVLMFVLLVTFMTYSYKRQRANTLLLQQKNELADINLQKDTLMNILAHDLKAPFNRIIGLCELMTVDKANREQYFEMIAAMSKSGAELIKDILDFSKLETGKAEENIESVDLESVLRRKIDHYKEDAQSKKISLKSSLDIKDHFVTNQLFLERIIDNLISNAIKYSYQNSSILIEAEKTVSNLRLKVVDEGPGFTDEDKEHLYEKFKPLSAKPTGGEASNGLGLSLVKTLVDKLKGEISLVSEAGKGSTFEVTIPEHG